MIKPVFAEIITIGDELLIGQVIDTNSAWMAVELNKAGIAVQRIYSIPDESDAISQTLEEAFSRADIVLMTGGLGPTKDDVTKRTLAAYFNSGMRLDQETFAHVTAIFERLKRPMIEANIRQAEVPECCTVIKNENGTAPCMWFNHDEKVLVAMPGVPFEMMYLMAEQVIPRLRVHFKLPAILHRTVLTAGIGESFLAKEIADIENELPAHIRLAYLPKLGQVRLRLSGSGNNEPELAIEIDYWLNKIVGRIGEYVVIAADVPLEKAILDFMAAKGLTLFVAESCTGGYISHLITQHPGCSAVFTGGAVVYSCDLKEAVLGVKHRTLEQFGAVSEQTVKEMAMGAVAKFNTDYAIAVSGIAGPEGATEQKPVGTVWIAIASRKEAKAKLFMFGNKRMQNIERSASAAFTFLLKQLKTDAS